MSTDARMPCGADLGRVAAPYTCARRPGHGGVCAGEPDRVAELAARPAHSGEPDAMSPERLDAIAARVDGAPAGPWDYFDGTDSGYIEVAADYQATGRGSYSCRRRIARVEAEDYWDDEANIDAGGDDEDAEELADQAARDLANFIAHSRADVPALLAEVNRLRAELAAEKRRATELREESAVAHAQLAAAVGVAEVMVWPELLARVTSLAARPSRADVLREAAKVAREYRARCQDVAEYEVADELERLTREADTAGGAP